ncbi:hypothetical protein [Streptacidiphilus jiangxiensis]|uniref:Uncharacterized protein n=1 Tax=Streptacidiphilus jiangxiensis TaxID=235985 RepID=A0A1H7Q777_STRJI|nr:hypothetical protein [Streptacidiphilus jiangxiensis]SEL43706.1 hypothetical protein SAMN05414137_108321 [Streptacidiphilus jiangxiensis]
MSPTRMWSEHRWIYVGAIVVLVGMMIAGLFTYTQQKANNQAANKAHQLNDALVAQGFPALKVNNIIDVLGTDGGAVCNDPNSALRRGLWLVQMANGAGGPGMRPVIADSRILEAGAEVVKVYCPDKLDDYQRKINDLKTGNTVRD